MQINEQESEGIFDINITPFVDVVLVLLVIFMVTAPMMVQQALTVNLPKTKTADALQSATLAIAITEQGQYLLNGELRTLQQIHTTAQQVFNKDPKVQIIFAADLASRHEAVVKAIDTIRSVGITKFAFQVVAQDS